MLRIRTRVGCDPSRIRGAGRLRSESNALPELPPWKNEIGAIRRAETREPEVARMPDVRASVRDRPARNDMGTGTAEGDHEGQRV
jgi:hypothetical protein